MTMCFLDIVLLTVMRVHPTQRCCLRSRLSKQNHHSHGQTPHVDVERYNLFQHMSAADVDGQYDISGLHETFKFPHLPMHQWLAENWQAFDLMVLGPDIARTPDNGLPPHLITHSCRLQFNSSSSMHLGPRPVCWVTPQPSLAGIESRTGTTPANGCSCSIDSLSRHTVITVCRTYHVTEGGVQQISVVHLVLQITAPSGIPPPTSPLLDCVVVHRRLVP
ncbi:hypothetical protein C8Q80DRAFT_1200292 [Daedaleopsis nitida]|nr:hypothetical protein C8Q80DRAFT_1200292 [Daedaleopsis nitida]